MTAQVYRQESKPVLLFPCSWCIRPQIMTTKGKCKQCGSPIKKQKYWNNTVKIMLAILKNKDQGIPVQINNKLYFVPSAYFDELVESNLSDWKETCLIVERIRRDCTVTSI